jgi:hypothetical protein
MDDDTIESFESDLDIYRRWKRGICMYQGVLDRDHHNGLIAFRALYLFPSIPTPFFHPRSSKYQNQRQLQRNGMKRCSTFVASKVKEFYRESIQLSSYSGIQTGTALTS